MEKKEQKKGKGCLIAVGIILITIIGLYIYGLTLTSTPAPLEKFFKDNNLGSMENVERQEQGLFERVGFSADGINYIAYINKDTKEVEKIYTTTTKGFPIYDKGNNDTTLDTREQTILKNKRYCLEQIRTTFKGEIREVTKDLKSQMNFPETFKLKKVDTYDMGTYLIQNISYTAQNVFGVTIQGYAKYKIDYETNKMHLVESN